MNKKGTFWKDLAAIMLWRWENVNWTAVIAWTAGAILAAAIYVGIAVAAVTLLSGCASQKEFHQQHQHTLEADTLAAEAHHDGHAQQQSQNIDSIVTASIWAAMQEFVSSEQEREVTTETLTETIDSLGRIIRQSQRTTDRSVSRQEQQRWQEQEERWQNELHATLRALDSAWSERLATVESHLRDTTVTKTDAVTATKTEPASWWSKLWSWLKGILVGIVIGILIACWRNVLSDFKRIARSGINRFEQKVF